MFTAMIAPEMMQLDESFFGMRKEQDPVLEASMLLDLAADIHTHGLMRPIKVYINDNGVPMVFSGKRRYVAMMVIAKGFVHEENREETEGYGSETHYSARKNHMYPVEVYSRAEAEAMRDGCVTMNLERSPIGRNRRVVMERLRKTPRIVIATVHPDKTKD